MDAAHAHEVCGCYAGVCSSCTPCMTWWLLCWSFHRAQPFSARMPWTSTPQSTPPHRGALGNSRSHNIQQPADAAMQSCCALGTACMHRCFQQPLGCNGSHQLLAPRLVQALILADQIHEATEQRQRALLHVSATEAACGSWHWSSHRWQRRPTTA